MSNVKQCKNHCRFIIQGFLRNVNQRRFSRSLRTVTIVMFDENIQIWKKDTIYKGYLINDFINI